MTESNEKVVEVIREVLFRKFPAAQTWNIFLTNERIIFQLTSRGTEELLFGVLGGMFSRIFRSMHKKSPKEISINDLISRNMDTLLISRTNASTMRVDDKLFGKRITITSPEEKLHKFDLSGKKMRRFQELLSQYPWADEVIIKK